MDLEQRTVGMEAAEKSTPKTFSAVLIDDSEEDRFALRRLLRRSASDTVFDIREADTGARGIALCRERVPDCLLLDYDLGDTDAVALLAELNKGRDIDDPVCPSVVLTGAGTVAQSAVRALQAGAQDYLVKETLTPEGIALAIQSAIEKVRLRREVRQTEARLAFAVAASDAGVFELDLTTDQCLYAPRTFDLLGIPRPASFSTAFAEAGDKIVFAPVPARMVWERVHPDDRNRIHDALQRICDVKNDAGGVLVEEYRIVLPSGEERWMATNGRVTFDDTGRALRLAGMVRDVTVRRREQQAVQELAAMQERLAEAVQQSLLLAPAPDAYPGIMTQTFYRSAWDDAFIGGDFFDIFAVSEETIALVVGDATGKGVAAATYTAEVKFAFRAFLREHNGSLPTALGLLNRFVYDNARLDAAHANSGFIALVAALVNPKTGAVSFGCAGAEPPLVLRDATGTVEEVPIAGPLLGALDDADYAEARDTLALGDLIALTSDGITEMRAPAMVDTDGKRRRGAFFGVEGLAKTLQEKKRVSPEAALPELQEAIINQAMDWSGGHPHDDICLLLARRTPNAVACL